MDINKLKLPDDWAKDYESPVTVQIQKIAQQIEEQCENEITLKISEQIGVNVDKDEMKRALAYDRDQYRRGYEDGWRARSEVIPKWVSVSEKLPNDRNWYLGVFKEPDTDFIGIPYICDYVGKVTKGTTNEGWILRHCTDVNNASDYFRNLICVAWRPLPKPYKKGGAE